MVLFVDEGASVGGEGLSDIIVGLIVCLLWL